MTVALQVIFGGRVQGVGFRYAARQVALGFDVTGTIQNLPDGTVQLQAVGEVEELEDFIDEITLHSEVSHHVQTQRISLLPLFQPKGFRIL